MSKAKKKAEPVEVATPALSERESRHYQEIRSLEATCDRLEGEYETAKTAASAAKGMWQEAVSRLRESIRRGPDPQMALPIGDDFMQTEIGDVLNLTDKQAESLAECGIYTVQDFEDVRSGNVPDIEGITDIPGVGQATADKWEDEILDWISSQQRATAPSPVCAGDDQDDNEEGGVS
jgi:hypothetical protein